MCVNIYINCVCACYSCTAAAAVSVLFVQFFLNVLKKAGLIRHFLSSDCGCFSLKLPALWTLSCLLFLIPSSFLQLQPISYVQSDTSHQRKVCDIAKCKEEQERRLKEHQRQSTSRMPPRVVLDFLNARQLRVWQSILIS